MCSNKSQVCLHDKAIIQNLFVALQVKHYVRRNCIIMLRYAEEKHDFTKTVDRSLGANVRDTSHPLPPMGNSNDGMFSEELTGQLTWNTQSLQIRK